MWRWKSCAIVGALFFPASLSFAGGGLFGLLDHRVNKDESGIWARHDQVLLEDLLFASVLGGALWEGGDTVLGQTFWRSLDASVMGIAAAAVSKGLFTRERPAQTPDPNQWFKGGGHYSFPSGDVTFVSAAITPFVLTYGPEHPVVYALEALPLYDAVARVKSQAHWQSDVLAGFALGTGVGYYATQRSNSLLLEALPGGFKVGLRKLW